jgi:hypothetical protein
MQSRNREGSSIALELVTILGSVSSIPSATLVTLHHPHIVDAFDTLGTSGVSGVIGVTPLTPFVATTTTSPSTVTTTTYTTTSTTCLSLHPCLTSFLALLFITRESALRSNVRATTIITGRRTLISISRTTRGVPLSTKIEVVADIHGRMKYILDVLQDLSARHSTIPVKSIIEGQGSRLLLVDVTKLCNITLAQPVNDMLVGLKSKVVAIR